MSNVATALVAEPIETQVAGVLQYRYVAAWHLLGGVSLPAGVTTIELYGDGNRRFLLTSAPDGYLEPVDRASIIGSLMLRSMFHGENSRDLPSRIEAELPRYREERNRRFGSGTYLIFEASGAVHSSTPSVARQVSDFVIAFDVVDNASIRALSHDDILAMKLALGLEGQTAVRFDSVADGTVLVDEKNRRIFSYSMQGGTAELTVSSAMKPEAGTAIVDRFERLLYEGGTGSVQRLFAEMADRKSDRLKRFVAGWAGLEILVVKAFKKYEQDFMSPLIATGPTSLREHFLGRLLDVMGDKYRVLDKFLVVSSMLFPDADPAAQEADLKLFKELKAQRDGIFHGNAFADQDLRIDDIEKLLRKYLSAYVESIPMLNSTQRRDNT